MSAVVPLAAACRVAPQSVSHVTTFRLRFGVREIVLPVGKFTMGRAADCTLRIDDEHLSRHHAALRVELDRVAVQDTGSRNGVLVNGVRIRSERYLVPGDSIRLGAHELTLLRDDEHLPFADTRTKEAPGLEAPLVDVTTDDVPSPEVLSEREREVLELLAHGHTLKAIAERLDVSVKTTETYRARISQKLGLRSRAHLVQYALRHGLVPTRPENE